MPNKAELLALAATEDVILEALTSAYNQGSIQYAYFSPAYDATIARATALRALAAQEPSDG